MPVAPTYTPYKHWGPRATGQRTASGGACARASPSVSAPASRTSRAGCTAPGCSAAGSSAPASARATSAAGPKGSGPAGHPAVRPCAARGKQAGATRRDTVSSQAYGACQEHLQQPMRQADAAQLTTHLGAALDTAQKREGVTCGGRVFDNSGGSPCRQMTSSKHRCHQTGRNPRPQSSARRWRACQRPSCQSCLGERMVTARCAAHRPATAVRTSTSASASICISTAQEPQAKPAGRCARAPCISCLRPQAPGQGGHCAAASKALAEDKHRSVAPLAVTAAHGTTLLCSHQALPST